MKTITIIVFTIILNACGGAKSTASNIEASKETTVETAKMTQDTITTIEYSAVTRGSFKQVKITNKTITFRNSRGEKPTTRVCTEEEWATLSAMLQKIDVKRLPSLEPPSKAHQYDGAAIATLIITKDGETYQTQSFDAGNPNAAIEDLVNELIAQTEVKE